MPESSRDKTIEVMARAYVSYLNVNWDDMSDYTKTIELEAAAFVLIAYESHLQASGMAVVPGWLPIESAPRDGTKILLCCATNANGETVNG